MIGEIRMKVCENLLKLLVAPLLYIPALQMSVHVVGAVTGPPIDRPRGLQKVVGAA